MGMGKFLSHKHEDLSSNSQNPCNRHSTSLVGRWRQRQENPQKLTGLANLVYSAAKQLRDSVSDKGGKDQVSLASMPALSHEYAHMGMQEWCTHIVQRE